MPAATAKEWPPPPCFKHHTDVAYTKEMPPPRHEHHEHIGEAKGLGGRQKEEEEEERKERGGNGAPASVLNRWPPRCDGSGWRDNNYVATALQVATAYPGAAPKVIKPRRSGNHNAAACQVTSTSYTPDT
ncbi:hypothetical protein Taro_024809 [Colocasia esculenta]|uniref:Uncharacterized protein n=1 Tax=Colocasia esculenta TaxID=4460 RepID=A0A843VCB7_COLES|nr:hypothetical protein [Colocasia esculenta]